MIKKEVIIRNLLLLILSLSLISTDGYGQRSRESSKKSSQKAREQKSRESSKEKAKGTKGAKDSKDQKASSKSASREDDCSPSAGLSRSREPRNLAQLQDRIRALLSKPELAAANVGIKITTLDGQVVFEENASKLLVPASNMKLYTTAAALEKLGADFRIRTSVYSYSRPDQTGQIKGDIVLYGRGDPSLGSRFNNDAESVDALALLARQLVNAGVKSVDGNLIADESYFRGSPLGYGWEWSDIQWSFGAEVSALTFSDNSVDVAIKPSSVPGEACFVAVTPDVGYVGITNQIQTSQPKTKREVGIYRGLEDNSVLVWGNLPVGDTGFQSRIAVHKPAAFTGYLFKEALRQVGIIVKGDVLVADSSRLSVVKPVDPTRDRLVELASIQSQPLAELVRVVNKFSQNLYAELLLRTLGKMKGSAELDSDTAGVEVVKEWLASVGVDTKILSILDGSGLSRRNLITASATTELLKYMSRRPLREPFEASLPVAGIDGSLTKRMVNTTAANNVKAKTGTVNNVTSLSGYVTTAGGDPLVFSIIINNFTPGRSQSRAVEDEICLLLASFVCKLGGAK
ncbi:MAG: D-alanyl-D-alanine carboxypeptidase/D-alanyl-D-alanine-endopeptidase [Blastocatellia bacterium]|nr:D-alanyl-D-alanine carboxypeptidase/D-alanyl-D-alanine-endopeptidase [Blastocatellia bacterium]